MIVLSILLSVLAILVTLASVIVSIAAEKRMDSIRHQSLDEDS